MERTEFLKTRIALYRRYLRESAEGDMARAYLWLIRQDEIELTTIVETHKNALQTDTDTGSAHSSGAVRKSKA